jgi:hypothetical protein
VGHGEVPDRGRVRCTQAIEGRQIGEGCGAREGTRWMGVAREGEQRGGCASGCAGQRPAGCLSGGSASALGAATLALELKGGILRRGLGDLGTADHFG